MGHHLSFLLARLIRYEDFVKTSSFLICTWAIAHSLNPPFAIRPHGQVFNLTADVWVLKKNDLKHLFLCFFSVMYDVIFRYINANPEAEGVPFRTNQHCEIMERVRTS